MKCMWGHFCHSLIQSISIYWALVLCQPYSRYRDTRREGDNVSNPVLVLCLQYSCPSTSLGSASVDSPNLRSKIFWEKKIMGNSIKQNLNSWVPGNYLHSIRYYKWSRDAFYNTVDLWTTSLNCKGPFVCGFFFSFKNIYSKYCSATWSAVGWIWQMKNHNMEEWGYEGTT